MTNPASAGMGIPGGAGNGQLPEEDFNRTLMDKMM
jgi:hypothetical protein